MVFQQLVSILFNTFMDCYGTWKDQGFSGLFWEGKAFPDFYGKVKAFPDSGVRGGRVPAVAMDWRPPKKRAEMKT